MSNETDAAPEDSGDSGLPKRRERLEALKALRENKPTANKDLGAAVAETQQIMNKPAMAPAGLGQPGLRRKIMASAYQMLTQTAQDERGMVEGTNFTVTGVERLTELLRERAEATEMPGSKAAASVLRFLSADDGDSTAVAGVGVDKLQTVARAVEGLRNRRRGRGPGPGAGI